MTPRIPWLRFLSLLVSLMALGFGGMACTRAEAPAPPASPTPTLRPRATRRPTRTPAPTPTLPSGDVFACIPEDAPRVRARVIQVYDGDTISVQMGVQVARVRYQGVDTPETKERRGEPPHPWGEAAKRRNRELVSGKWVTLVWDPRSEDRDHYGRLLRYVIVDDVFVNDTLLREGLAWYYPSEHACSAQFLQAEAEARAAKRGIWSGATPTPIP
ncbi:MAG: thermonuclease family protein [Chloroflexi bacterium]|nr:thermonuclease family protein [Chloroflexota bacterium]